MNRIKLHVSFWITYFLIAYFSDIVLNNGVAIWIEVIFFTTNDVYLFYSIYLLIVHFANGTSKSLISGILYSLVMVGFFIGFRYWIRFDLLTNHYDPNYGAIPVKRWLVSSGLWIVTFTIYSLAYYYFETSLAKQKRISEIQTKSLLQEQERLNLENSLLRSQINPHFLYNILNLLYAKSLPLSGPLSDGILKLSEMMRYSLKNNADGLSSLNEEIEHVENVLHLAKLRFNDRFYFHTDFDEFDDSARVVPLLFITLIENILKHGEVSDPRHPAKVSILKGDGESIKFVSQNEKRISGAEKSMGIGLPNAESRLREVYGQGNYTMMVENLESTYIVKISMPILSCSKNREIPEEKKKVA